VKKQVVIKVVVNSKMDKDLYNTVHCFLKQYLNNSIWLGILSNYSLRISYKGSDDKLDYTTVIIKDDAKNINLEELSEEVIHRLNNRRISLFSIKGLHLHLHFE